MPRLEKKSPSYKQFHHDVDSIGIYRPPVKMIVERSYKLVNRSEDNPVKYRFTYRCSVMHNNPNPQRINREYEK
jgi:hypothetical protein